MFTRTRRCFVASLLVLGFLCSQFAVAAYACSETLGTVAAIAADETSAFVACEQMHMGEGAQTDDPLRCLAHCQYGQQNLNSISPVDIPQMAMVVLFELPPPTERSISTVAFTQPTLLAHSTSPPAYAARSRRLRI